MNSDNYTLEDFKSVGGLDVFDKADFFAEFAQDMRAKQFETYRVPLASPSSNQVVVGGRGTGPKRKMIMLASNNYLGLTTHPRVIRACHDALDQYGSASGGPPLLSGTFIIHEELEAQLAALKGCEDAVLFPSGYAANLGTVAALVGPRQVAVFDRLCHASVMDGARLSQGGVAVFRHNDANHLERVLKRCRAKYEGALVVIDGVYSTNGCLANLPDIVQVVRAYNARLLIDDAHGTGVMGPQGRGTPAEFGLEDDVDIVMGTLSKALGGLGGFVAGPRKVVDYLRYFGRSYFFSTTIPPATVAGVLAAIRIIQDEPWIRERLWNNIAFLRKTLSDAGFDLGNSKSPILPIMVGDELKLRRMSRELYEAGIYASAFQYPAVPRRQARIRLSVTASLSVQEIEEAADAVCELGRKYGLLPQEATTACVP